MPFPASTVWTPGVAVPVDEEAAPEDFVGEEGGLPYCARIQGSTERRKAIEKCMLVSGGFKGGDYFLVRIGRLEAVECLEVR